MRYYDYELWDKNACSDMAHLWYHILFEIKCQQSHSYFSTIYIIVLIFLICFYFLHFQNIILFIVFYTEILF